MKNKPDRRKGHFRRDIPQETLYWSTALEARERLHRHLTHFSPMSHFYTPRKRQKTYGFLTFSGRIEM